MQLDLKNKRALVTGASSGIGEGIARHLAAEGVRVAVHGRDPERTNGVAAAIREDGGSAVPVTGDITNDEGANSVAEAVRAELKCVDILINVVGGPGGALTWENTTTQQWLEQYELNTLTAVRMINHFLPGMKEQGLGRIIQIGSIASVRPLPNQVPAYCASKAALLAVSLSLAMTVAGTGVTVNTINSGFIATEGLKDYVLNMPGNEGSDWADIEAEVAKSFRCMVGRLGLPKDIASMVAFLASPHSDWITGSTFRIDGGTADWIG